MKHLKDEPIVPPPIPVPAAPSASTAPSAAAGLAAAAALYSAVQAQANAAAQAAAVTGAATKKDGEETEEDPEVCRVSCNSMPLVLSHVLPCVCVCVCACTCPMPWLRAARLFRVWGVGVCVWNALLWPERHSIFDCQVCLRWIRCLLPREVQMDTVCAMDTVSVASMRKARRCKWIRYLLPISWNGYAVCVLLTVALRWR